MNKANFVAVMLSVIGLAPLPGTKTLAATYSTTFPNTETPLSEYGHWLNGKTAGLDWSDVASSNKTAWCTEPDAGYDDSTAILTGTWGPNQVCTGTIYYLDTGVEVEFRLRSSISAHVCSGYECNFTSSYCQIVRWNGALGDFNMLTNNPNAGITLTNGDNLKASISNNVITTYIHGVVVAQITDNAFADGNPGIGFYGSPQRNSNAGFTSVTFTDNQGTITNAPLIAGFVADPTNGTAPLSVSFINLSSGATNYTWAFGDGHTSSSTNPANIYANAGSYSVSLTAVGSGGTNTLTLPNYILVAAPQPVTILSALVTNGQFSFSFWTVNGQSYTIQQKTNLSATNWVGVTNFVGSGLAFQFSMPAADSQSGTYFRVREP